MTSISWNAEGGSDGTAVSTANSGGASGTAWDTCQRGTSATNEYDSAQFANGALSVLIATAGTSTTAYNRWGAALTALWASGLTTHYGRFMFRLAAIPGTNRILVEFLDTAAATNRANFLMLTTGALRLRNAANGTVATFTTVCGVDTWYRVEYRVDGSTTGAYEMHLYAGNSLTALEDIVGGTANFGGTVGCVNYGYVSNGASLANLWFDSLQINDVALPGPESGTPATVLDTTPPAVAWGSPNTTTAAVTITDTTPPAAALASAESTTAAATVPDTSGLALAGGSPDTISAAVLLVDAAGQALAGGSPDGVTAAASVTDTTGLQLAAGAPDDTTAAALLLDTTPPAAAWGAGETTTAAVTLTDNPSPAAAWGSTDTTSTSGGVVTILDTTGFAMAAGRRDCVRGGTAITRPDTGSVYRPDSGKVCRP